jgi:hypothetical protein
MENASRPSGNFCAKSKRLPPCFTVATPLQARLSLRDDIRIHLRYPRGYSWERTHSRSEIHRRQCSSHESNRVRDHLFTLPRDGFELYIIPYAKGGSLPSGLTTFQIERLSFAEVKRWHSRETEDTDSDRSESERTAFCTSIQASTS